MLKTNPIRLPLCLSAALVTALATPTGALAKSGATTITIDGQRVDASRVDDSLARAKRRFRRSGKRLTPEIRASVKKQTIRTLLVDELLDAGMKKNGLTVTKADLEAMAQKRQQEFAHKKGYDAYVKATGQSSRDVDAFMRRMIRLEKLSMKLKGKKPPTRAEAQKELKDNKTAYKMPAQHRLSQILLTFPSDAREAQRDEVRRRATGIQRKATAQPKKFRDLAKQYSQGPTAKDGGKLGFVRAGRLASEIDDALEGSKVGDIIGPVETDHGVHIFIVEELRAEHQSQVGEWESVIYNNMSLRWRTDMQNEVLTDLFTQLNVKVTDPDLTFTAADMAPKRGRGGRGRR